MQLGALRDMSAEDTTFVGPFPAPEERTARGFFLAPIDDKTETARVEPPSGDVKLVQGESQVTVFTADMIELLRTKLREAEAREERLASGVRARSDDSLDVEVDVDVEPARTLDELEEVLSPLPELEVALAPNSDSNFYAGFDESHPDGVFLATYERFSVGAPVYATVILPAGLRFRTAAMVEWVREAGTSATDSPAGVGLRLCGLDARAWALITRFVRHRRPMFYLG